MSPHVLCTITIIIIIILSLNLPYYVTGKAVPGWRPMWFGQTADNAITFFGVAVSVTHNLLFVTLVRCSHSQTHAYPLIKYSGNSVRGNFSSQRQCADTWSLSRAHKLLCIDCSWKLFHKLARTWIAISFALHANLICIQAVRSLCWTHAHYIGHFN